MPWIPAFTGMTPRKTTPSIEMTRPAQPTSGDGLYVVAKELLE